MTPLTPEEIKSIRSMYGLSQRSFALLLGLGEATIARYETGATEPSKANAKLIRAAADPKFMLQCLAEDGDAIPQLQFSSAERYIYAVIPIDAEEVFAESAASYMNRVYELTLRQEVLNEQAANIACDIMRIMERKGIDIEDEGNAYVVLLHQLMDLKETIVSCETESHSALDKIAGYLANLELFVKQITASELVA